MEIAHAMGVQPSSVIAWRSARMNGWTSPASVNGLR